jgi:hypothetical protein
MEMNDSSGSSTYTTTGSSAILFDINRSYIQNRIEPETFESWPKRITNMTTTPRCAPGPDDFLPSNQAVSRDGLWASSPLCSVASLARSTRELTPSFANTSRKCALTVCGDRKKRSATWRLGEAGCDEIGDDQL